MSIFLVGQRGSLTSRAYWWIERGSKIEKFNEAERFYRQLQKTKDKKKSRKRNP